MKALMIVTAAVLGMTSLAFGYDEGKIAEFKIDWSKSKNEHYITMVCDDTYYKGVEITVPGRAFADFDLTITHDYDCSVKNMTMVKDGSGAVFTKVELNNSSSCTINIRNNNKPGQTALIGMDDAC
jgi:hypothetical protein